MPASQLLLKITSLFDQLYEEPENRLIRTLALIVTGLFFAHNVQLWQIALWLPLQIQLLSIVRRFERFLANPDVDVSRLFQPFVNAMRACSGDTAYLILDCTQAGKHCRTLFIGLAYHGTVLPVAWKTIKGKKGHVTGQFQRDLLAQAYRYFGDHPQVIVLGDAEFSNCEMIDWLQKTDWDFVFRFQSSYLIQLTPAHPWITAQGLYHNGKMSPDQVRHWEQVAFTQTHKLTGLTVTVHWGADEDDPLCLISSLPASAQPHLIYQLRAWIETLFGHHKSRAFQLARTHLSIPKQIDRLFLAIAIASCIILGLGTQLVLSNQTRLVDRADRRDLSLFQLGLRWLYRLLALGDLHKFKMVFKWNFTLPPPGFQTAN